MKTITIAVLVFFQINYILHCSQDSIRVVDSSTAGSASIDEENSISLPKFDVHLCIYLPFYNIGVRALVMDYLSLEAGIGLLVQLPIPGGVSDPESVHLFGANYHLPFWHDLAISGLVLFTTKELNAGRTLHMKRYTFAISYIPMINSDIHFNCMIGGSFIFRTKGLFKDLNFLRLLFVCGIGISYSFP